MKILRTLLRWLCWMAFAAWTFLSFVKGIFWLAYLVTAPWGPAIVVTFALLVQALPWFLFLWVNRSPQRLLHAFPSLDLALLALLISESLLTIAVGTNSWDVILFQAALLAAMFTPTAFHQNESFALE
ncbi:hypothetical protein [Prosthecobacter dejongeii]|uniref:Uncharacterized protein n=1 Tax=Prosthecobacter dejongeii TaxID=48465 RepID=A0A7W8DQZ5_9BACT|nr:hypothetical protein [Prosthecobacter dejongeii]MBB5038391.1 hypothetical protein [Prosthecobacter dejongeii]